MREELNSLEIIGTFNPRKMRNHWTVKDKENPGLTVVEIFYHGGAGEKDALNYTKKRNRKIKTNKYEPKLLKEGDVYCCNGLSVQKVHGFNDGLFH